MELWERVYFGNSLGDWLVAAAVLVGTLGAIWVVMRILASRLAAFAHRTETDLDDLLAQLLSRAKLLLLFVIALFAASLTLALAPLAELLLRRAALIALALQAGVWAGAAISFYVERYCRKASAEDAATVTTVTALGFAARIVVWLLVVLLVLDNFGVQVTALVTGLGIGGIAVALALQSILGDLFAALAIVLDKPFAIGDYVTLGDYQGNVEFVGLKTTRLRSLTGEQLIVSNSDMLSSRIRNYGRLHERRMRFTVGVTYDTPREKLEAIPGMFREIVDAQEDARFDRSHLREFGDFSIDFETVYYVTRPEYAVALDVQQAINLELHRRLEESRIEFAYPTQLVYTRPMESGETAS